jgi:hypothetical protein
VRMPLRIPRPARTQFTLRGMMVIVAIAGLILGFLAWLSRWAFDLLDLLAAFLKPTSPSVSHEVTIYVGPYGFSSASPAFWPALCLGFAVLAGILVGVFTAILFAVNAQSPIMRSPPPPAPGFWGWRVRPLCII